MFALSFIQTTFLLKLLDLKIPSILHVRMMICIIKSDILSKCLKKKNIQHSIISVFLILVCFIFIIYIIGNYTNLYSSILMFNIVKLPEWLKSKPANQASESSSPIRCKYLYGYNLIPSGEGNGKPPLRKFSPGKITVERVYCTL